MIAESQQNNVESVAIEPFIEFHHLEPSGERRIEEKSAGLESEMGDLNNEFGRIEQSSPSDLFANSERQPKVQDDPDPIVIRKKYPGVIPPYVQKIQIKYLQPPPVEPPGPIIIKEILPPAQPLPPPLHIRQRPKVPPTPPPIVLRECPPPMPPKIPTQIVYKRLPAPPSPARRVIIERAPTLPPKPPTIFIERWIPYKEPPKRVILYQKAKSPPPQGPHKNIVVVYEGAPMISREIKSLGVVDADPQSYVDEFGGSLLDSNTIISQVAKAGIGRDAIEMNQQKPVVKHLNNAWTNNYNQPPLIDSYQPNDDEDEIIRI